MFGNKFNEEMSIRTLITILFQISMNGLKLLATLSHDLLFLGSTVGTHSNRPL